MALRRYTAAEAAALYGIPAARIHEAKARGTLHPIGYIPGPGRNGLQPLYAATDLQALATRYHQRTTKDQQP